MPRLLIQFQYDYQGRRIYKRITDTTNAPTFQYLGTHYYLYDAWNLIAEYRSPDNTPPTLARHYPWGLDLSNTPQSAGGIGGLLATTDHTTASTHLHAYDGNGNTIALINATTSTPRATYDYDPFGIPLRYTGAQALQNPFRFSTKYTDNTTGLLYYGYRTYNPVLGRWLNRDPIAEQGGPNLCAFVGNNGVNELDFLGMSIINELAGLVEFAINQQIGDVERKAELRRGIGPWGFSAQHCWAACYLGVKYGLIVGHLGAAFESIAEIENASGYYVRDILANHAGASVTLAQSPPMFVPYLPYSVFCDLACFTCRVWFE